MAEIRAKVGEDIAGLTVHKTAYDATNNTNAVTTIEEFTAKPVGLYDTETGKWVDVPVTVLDDLSTIQSLNKEGDRYAVALGDNFDEAEGFMNLDEYINQVKLNETTNNQVEESSAPKNGNLYETVRQHNESIIGSKAENGDDFLGQLKTQNSTVSASTQSANSNATETKKSIENVNELNTNNQQTGANNGESLQSVIRAQNEPITKTETRSVF